MDQSPLPDQPYEPNQSPEDLSIDVPPNPQAVNQGASAGRIFGRVLVGLFCVAVLVLLTMPDGHGHGATRSEKSELELRMQQINQAERAAATKQNVDHESQAPLDAPDQR